MSDEACQKYQPSRRAMAFVDACHKAAARIARDSTGLSDAEATQLVARQVFDLAEAIGETSSPLAAAVAEYVSDEVRRLRHS